MDKTLLKKLSAHQTAINATIQEAVSTKEEKLRLAEEIVAKLKREIEEFSAYSNLLDFEQAKQKFYGEGRKIIKKAVATLSNKKAFSVKDVLEKINGAYSGNYIYAIIRELTSENVLKVKRNKGKVLYQKI
jgi:hypothetical protein